MADERRDAVVETVTLLLQHHPGEKHTLVRCLSEMLWAWTEARGKYSRDLPWSQGAIEAHAELGSIQRAKLQHEHVVPRRLVILALLDMPSPTAAKVRAFLGRYAIACVVTRNEHATLPDLPWETLQSDPWARYLGVEVVQP